MKLDADQAAGYPLNQRECRHQHGIPCLDCGLCEGGKFSHTFELDRKPGFTDRCGTCFGPAPANLGGRA